ncbi:MAG: hypothetical protein ACRDD5_06300 [Silvania sp.]|uniref:hypothetical protein n=1 Tax=Silvania sp. TaxID=3016633 RepID=UPI003EE7369F
MYCLTAGEIMMIDGGGMVLLHLINQMAHQVLDMEDKLTVRLEARQMQELLVEHVCKE